MLISHAYAQATGAAPADAGMGLIGLLPFVAIFAVFWFLILRPQQQRAKRQADAVAAVKKNDAVVTAGGIVGKVTKVEDRFVEVEIAPNTRIRVVKATLAEVTSNTAKPAND